ncbi:hypothetical protein QTI24_22285 [Variovorax sp. J22P240]|uniref:hypothetical protein n=1 Tax=Variovorax sp. J22P240 TaxID=3053514 RepID=UPI00257872C3|nr:hypothetical protein [Variovorax sp. J22P240]MDM0001351.1 hypothetical protein [Variovorax sp. J22P240]
MTPNLQGPNIDGGSEGGDPIAEFFVQGAEDRYSDWDLFANMVHWASVSAGLALMMAAGLGFF